MPKNNRSGKAAILTRKQFAKLQASVTMDSWKLFYEVLWHTGERYGAVRQLKIADVFDGQGNPLEFITFQAMTRKRAAGRAARTRQVWVNETLQQVLIRFELPTGDYLFPGALGDSPISASACDKQFRVYANAAGLRGTGHSLHSFRHSFITRAAENGISLATIQQLTGHKDIRSLAGYVQTSLTVIQNAMAAIA